MLFRVIKGEFWWLGDIGNNIRVNMYLNMFFKGRIREKGYVCLELFGLYDFFRLVKGYF